MYCGLCCSKIRASSPSYLLRSVRSSMLISLNPLETLFLMRTLWRMGSRMRGEIMWLKMGRGVLLVRDNTKRWWTSLSRPTSCNQIIAGLGIIRMGWVRRVIRRREMSMAIFLRSNQTIIAIITLNRLIGWGWVSSSRQQIDIVHWITIRIAIQIEAILWIIKIKRQPQLLLTITIVIWTIRILNWIIQTIISQFRVHPRKVNRCPNHQTIRIRDQSKNYPNARNKPSSNQTKKDHPTTTTTSRVYSLAWRIGPYKYEYCLSTQSRHSSTRRV